MALRADSYVAACDRLNCSLHLMYFGRFTLVKVQNALHEKDSSSQRSLTVHATSRKEDQQFRNSAK